MVSCVETLASEAKAVFLNRSAANQGPANPVLYVAELRRHVCGCRVVHDAPETAACAPRPENASSKIAVRISVSYPRPCQPIPSHDPLPTVWHSAKFLARITIGRPARNTPNSAASHRARALTNPAVVGDEVRSECRGRIRPGNMERIVRGSCTPCWASSPCAWSSSSVGSLNSSLGVRSTKLDSGR